MHHFSIILLATLFQTCYTIQEQEHLGPLQQRVIMS
jgi:hypothetical protein